MLRPISSARLTLRPFSDADAPARLRYQSREDVATYLRRPPHDAVTVLQGMRRNVEGRFLADDDRLLYAVQTSHSGEVIGEVSGRLTSALARQVELSWVFDPDFGHHGYATEAAAALITDLFANRNVHRVFARMDSANTTSIRLCERLNLRHEASFTENELIFGSWASEVIYAVLVSEWPIQDAARNPR